MSTELWPRVTTEAELDGLKERTTDLLPGVAAVAQREGLDPTPVDHYPGGSLPVFELAGSRVLKLYPEMYRNDFAIESAVLAHIDGRVATPKVLATGELDGWSYLLMTRLPGRPLEDVWPELTAEEEQAIGDQIGAWMAALHALPCAGLELPLPPWPEFLAHRYAIATEEQRRLGLGAPWLEQVGPFLERIAIDLDPGPEALALLHTEMAREHIFVDERAGRWTVSGVLDFEPSMRGAREYEFASVGIFTAGGDARFLRQVLLGYGYAESDLDEALRLRFMAYTLLHRYTHLGWYLRRMPPLEGVDSLEALARQWWAW